MDSACICLRNSSNRLTRSVSAEIVSSSPFCTSSCWSIRSRSKSCSRSLGSDGAPEGSGWRESACNCSWLRRRSARVMMLLLMRTIISSTTVSSWPADGLVWAISQGAPTNVASRRTANLFIKYLIRRASAHAQSHPGPKSLSFQLFYRVWACFAGAGRQRRILARRPALVSIGAGLRSRQSSVFISRPLKSQPNAELLKSRRQLKYHALAVSAARYGRSEEVAHSVGSHAVVQVGSVGRSSEGVEYALIPAAAAVWS